MEEAFAEQIVPGTFIRVLSEGLIAPKGIAFGNVGIVGMAAAAADAPAGTLGRTHILGSLEDAQRLFKARPVGNADTDPFGLMRGLAVLFGNGARTVYAHGLAAGADTAAFNAGIAELLKDEINILVAPELTTEVAKASLASALETAENNGRDLMGVIGADATGATAIGDQVAANKRIVMAAPAIRAFDPVVGDLAVLPAGYSACAVAGLMASLAPQSSPTNKVLPGIAGLATRFSYGELKALLTDNVCVLEDRQGIRVVRGITTEGAAFAQITTRRIVDFAKAGVRQVANPFIGKLNNERVRKALHGALDSFLTTMVVDEALTGYELEVKASRADEIAGRCVVNVSMQPTFSIDYIRVTLALS